MIQILMAEATVHVSPGPNKTKAVIAECLKSGIQVVIPMSEDAARAIAAALGSSGLIVASELPKVKTN